MSSRKNGTPPGPPERPLVPGHLGTPSEETCRAALTVLAVADVMAEDFGHEDVLRRVENEIHDLGITPSQLKAWARRHIEEEGHEWVTRMAGGR